MKEINFRYDYGYLRAIDKAKKSDLENYFLNHFRDEFFRSKIWRELPEDTEISILKSIQIEKELRKKGYGSNLMKEYLSMVESKYIFLLADESRSGKTLPEFYKKFGFEIIVGGLHPIMVKNLGRS